MRLPVITVELGAYGTQEVDFNDYLSISTDLVEELHKDASNYAYIESIESELRTALKRKQAEFANTQGRLTGEITEELTKELGKKPTAKDIDARLDSDDTVVRFKEEIIAKEYQISIVAGQLSAMRMRHSDLKKLVEIELAQGRMGNLNVNTEEKVNEKEVEKFREEGKRNKPIRGKKGK